MVKYIECILKSIYEFFNNKPGVRLKNSCLLNTLIDEVLIFVFKAKLKTSLSHILCIEKLLIVNVEKAEFNFNRNVSFKVACAHEMVWKNVCLYLSCCLDPRLTLKLLDRFRLNFNKTWTIGQNIWNDDFKSFKNETLFRLKIKIFSQIC